MILNTGVGFLVFIAAAAAQQPAPQQAQQSGSVAPAGDGGAAARRLAATVQLAAQEYAIGVKDGRVVAEAEVEEARLFLTEARRTAERLPRELEAVATAEIDALLEAVRRTGPPDSVDAGARRLAGTLAERLGITLEAIPAHPPSLARGAEVYRQYCASCHGESGRGDGPLAAGMAPPPADLTDADALRDASPLDFYRRVTIGVAGTAMPAFEDRLTPDDRWAAAAYATLLRLPPPHGEVPAALRDFAATARMSDAALIQALAEVGATDRGAGAGDADVPLARVAAVRSVQEDSAGILARVFAQVRRQLDTAVGLARAGQHPAASAAALDAYMAFEQVERSVRAQNASLVLAIERNFSLLRTAVGTELRSGELERARDDLLAGLENAQRVLGTRLSPANAFVQSLVIMIREGLEAILIVGALIAFLVKIGASDRRRDIHLGVGGAVGASLLTAVALETMFRLSPASREALEGVTMLVATVVLFGVSYWLLSKMEVAKWTGFVRSRVQEAVTSGSALALASAAFLAVYREGFETVLFYKALFVAAGSGEATMAILAGMGLGGALMAGVYVAMTRYGIRLPLKPFFACTSAFLYYMAFVFAGNGIAELQEGGLLPTTVAAGAPRLPALGIYPTVETLAAQGLLLVLLGIAVVWTFVLEPRRARSAERMPAAAAAREPGPGRGRVGDSEAALSG